MEGENVSLMENRRAKELSERDEFIEQLIKERYQTWKMCKKFVQTFINFYKLKLINFSKN